ncbi:uncharacterized protein LOC119103025 [Pollicipes pollicipes]|uniref:uncharacterized protein LOC119103025 n=1 Tax=Pollicipes pollicipes TaxID=41117 RepID=UPI001885435B|nr:uncharacterized protein LOC119103025 [Pollicipes pollicipes]
MATLRRLLWTNGADLADARFCPRRCHRALGLSCWQQFSEALLAVGRPHGDVTSTLSDVIPVLVTAQCLSGEQAAWLAESAAVVRDVTDDPVDIGRMFVYIGGAQMSVLGQLMAVDPVEERKLLLEYSKDEMEDVEADLAAADLAMQLVSGVRLAALADQHVPPALAQQRQRLLALDAERAELDVGEACRPTPPLYQQLKQLRARLRSFSGFVAGLEGRYGWYRDLTAPLLAAYRQNAP